MLNSIRRRLLLLPTTRRRTPSSSPHGLVFFLLPTNPSPPKSLFSTTTTTTTTAPDSLTLTFLIDSCGLSPESAIVAVRKLPRLRSTENPNTVLRLLRDYGFGETHIAELISRQPAVLSSDPQSTLRPKLEALRGFGFSGESLVRLLTANPLLLKRSLEEHIIPCFTFLRTLLPAEGDFVSVFTREPRGLNASLNNVILPILGVLRKHNLPEERISQMIKIHARILLIPPGRVDEIVEEVKAAGVLPSDSTFIYAIRGVAGQKRGNWERKMAVFQSFGLSEADFVSSFRRRPWIIMMSEEKIRRGLQFFLHRLKLPPDDIVRYPILLCYSLEKRILPRSAVMSVLKRKGKLEESSSVVPALLATTSSFLKSYVARYRDDVPEVLEAYNAEIKFDE